MSQMPPREPRDDSQSRSPKRPRRAGTEPLTARSDLGLRTVLSTAALVVFALATAGFAWWATSSSRDSSPSPTVLGVLAAVCGVLLLVAVLDLAVIHAAAIRATWLKQISGTQHPGGCVSTVCRATRIGRPSLREGPVRWCLRSWA